MDPFIIIKNYRQQRQAMTEEIHAPRIFLRELDPNALVSRQIQSKPIKIYCEDDKENYNFMEEMDYREDMMKKLPTPNQSHLINYSDYDLTY